MNKSYFAGILTVVVIGLIYVAIDAALDHNRKFDQLLKHNIELNNKVSELESDTTTYRRQLRNDAQFADNQNFYMLASQINSVLENRSQQSFKAY